MQEIEEKEKIPLLFEAEIINVPSKKITKFKKDIYLNWSFCEIHKFLRAGNLSDGNINNAVSNKYAFFGICVKYKNLLDIVGNEKKQVLNEFTGKNNDIIIDKIRNETIAHFKIDGQNNLSNIGFNTNDKITPFGREEYFYLDRSIINTLSNLCAYFSEYYSGRVTKFITENEKNIIKKDIFIKHKNQK